MTVTHQYTLSRCTDGISKCLGSILNVCSRLFTIASKADADRRASRIAEVESRRGISYRAWNTADTFRPRWLLRSLPSLPDRPKSDGGGNILLHSCSSVPPAFDISISCGLKQEEGPCRPSFVGASMRIRCPLQGSLDYYMLQSFLRLQISYSVAVIYSLVAHCLSIAIEALSVIQFGHIHSRDFQ